MTQTLPDVLLTRPLEASRIWAKELAGVAQVTVSPVLEIVPLADLPDLRGATAVLFTSRHAVRPRPATGPALCHVVGRQTAQAAKAAGWNVGHQAKDACQLVESLIAEAPQGPMLHCRGVHSHLDLADTLTSAGIETENCILYDQQTRTLSQEATRLLQGESAVIVPLFSARSAGQFVNEAKGARNMHLLALSAAVADAASPAFWQSQTIADQPTGEAMRRALGDLLSRVHRLETR